MIIVHSDSKVMLKTVGTLSTLPQVLALMHASTLIEKLLGDLLIHGRYQG